MPAHYIKELWNTTEDTPTQENPDQENPTETLVLTIILCSFSVIGILGNGLVLYVFTRNTVKLTSTIFILALAGTDFLTCLIVIPFTVVAIHIKYKMTYDVVCKMYQFFITCNVPLSAFIMVAIAVDRYICICHPFVHIMTVRRAKIIFVILSFFAVLLGFMTSLGFSVYMIVPVSPDNITTTPMPVNSITEHTKSHFVSIVSENINGSELDFNYPKYAQPTENLQDASSTLAEYKVEFEGTCQISPVILPMDFITAYQKIYSAFYLFSLLIVLILYGMIYSSVTKQRAKRRAQKMGRVKKVNMQCQTDESTMPLNTLNNENNHVNRNCKLKVEMAGENFSTTATTTTTNVQELSGKQMNGNANNSETHPLNRTSSKKHSPSAADPTKAKKDHNRLANIKTAVMLFIVTIVFIIAFLPAWLMAHRWLTFNRIVFYGYFSYNVANPVIYAFMNQTFREQMCKIFSNCRGYCNVRH